MEKKIKLHYVWLGGAPKSKLIYDCIASWKRCMPDAEICEWNDETIKNFDNKYLREAISNRKWAFASDYIRLRVLYDHGGIYLDTDVLMFRSLAEFYDHEFFTGFEKYEGRISPVTAVMGCKQGNAFAKRLLENYDTEKFILPDGSLNFETNTKKITKVLVDWYRFDPETDIYQEREGIHIYPSYYFCTPDGEHDSYSAHLFNGSWVPTRQKLYKKIVQFLRRVL